MSQDSFGDRLKNVRNKLGLSQDKIAKLLEISQHTYSNYETNKRQPDILFVGKIKELSKVNLDWLISGIGSPFQENIFFNISDPELREFLRLLKKHSIVRLAALTSLEMLKVKYPNMFKKSHKKNIESFDASEVVDDFNVEDITSEV